MTAVRRPAVAGLFYPDDPKLLASAIAELLDSVPINGDEAAVVPKAIIAPHAGYVYSGPIAAAAYARLRALKGKIRRVVLLGPAHRVVLRGLAVPRVEAFETPLGPVELDLEAISRIVEMPQVTFFDEAHRLEHSIEVHMPFLIATLGKVKVVPIVVGDATGDEVAEVIEALWNGPDTLIVISSDLSHYHDYRTARQMDRATSDAIEALDERRIGSDQACGCVPIAGLLRVARRRGLAARTVDLRNSGDTAGPAGEVVGYGAYVFS